MSAKFYPSSKIDVVWCGNVSSIQGFSNESISLILALCKHSKYIRLKIVPMLHPGQIQIKLEHKKSAAIRKLIKKACMNNPIVIYHLFMQYFFGFGNPEEIFKSSARANIVRTTFETHRIFPESVDYLNRFEQVWVPSKFNIKTFGLSGVKVSKLCLIPEIIDFDCYNPSIPPYKKIYQPHKFTFLSIFTSCNFHIVRKGMDVLLKAYSKEFSQHEKVRLLLHIPCSSKEESRRFYERIREEYKKRFRLFIDSGPEIDFSFSPLSDMQMPGLYKSSDAFVLASRGEGWGRIYMEAMAMGIPTIGTGWGGNTDFMNESNSYLIDYNLVDSAYSSYPNKSNAILRWAEPSVTHLRAIMRDIFSDRQKAKQKGVQARKDILKNYGWKQIARLMEIALLRCNSQSLKILD